MNVPTVNKQIIFVDSSVQDYHSLIQNADATQIFILNENLSGIEQITHALANQKDIKALHILSHGSDGILFLGNSHLHQTTLETHAHTVQQWGKALKPNADILLYGCNVAQTYKGKAFVKRLSQLTKANVAASTTPTGNAHLGGDWNLEFITGKIKATLAFSPKVTAAYSGVLGDGPGGVGTTDGTSTLEVWLKADAIAGLTGNPVSTWSDRSGNNVNATQSNVGNQPAYTTNVLNGLPVVRFDGSNDRLEFNRVIQDDFSIIAVFKTAQSAGGGTQWYLGVGLVDAEVGGVTNDFGMSLIAGKLATGAGNPDVTALSTSAFSDNNGHIANFQRVLSSGVISQFTDGASTATATAGTNSLTAPTRIVLGSLQTNINYFSGDIAEVLVYSSALNKAERTIVDNYLSAKYNISLTSGDYYAGDTTPNGNYDWNVAGIGQEANGSNTSGNTKGGLIIDNGTFLQDNGDYLIAGQIETANATNVTTDLPSATASNRLSRVWYLDKTDINNNGGTANLTFDFSDSGLGGTPTGKYHLLYRSGTTGTFAYVNNATSTTSNTFTITGDQVTFNNVNLGLLNDGYYTLASKVNDVPLLDTITNPAAINEDAGLQTITLTGISDLETATNALTLTATSANTALTGTPTITNNNDGTATLTYTPIANANGTANISVTVTDADSGTVTKSFDISVNPVNDQPSFSNSGNQTLAAGTNTLQTVPSWANAFNFGPNEASQAVANFLVNTTGGNSLFTSLPHIANDGTLTYTPNGTPGTATIQVQLQDNGGTANIGDVDTSTASSFTISIPAPTVNLSVSPTIGTEAGTTSITVTATAAVPVVGNQKVDLALTGVATAADFIGPIPTQITIANGTSSGSVTFTITDDQIDEINETANLTISNPSAGIQLGTTTTGSFTITDNDTAGFDILPISGNTSEFGGIATFDIRLKSQPTADVILGLTSNNTAEGTVLPANLTFNSTNWNAYQTVTITGVDDAVADGDIAYQIITAPDTTTADTNYNNLNPADVTVTNTDNDTPGVTVTQSAGSTEVTEGGITDTYTLQLNTLPTSNVDVTVTADAQGRLA
jgi:hypothetical protein